MVLNCTNGTFKKFGKESDMIIINAILALSIIGFAAGGTLAVACKIFYVVEDPRLEAVKNALPGINCGGCGFAGCAGAAKAVVSGKADANVCLVGGFEVTRKISEILGVHVIDTGPVTAVAGCTGGVRAETKYYYKGLNVCRAEYLLYGGDKTCETGCLGDGDCVRACMFDAIRMGPDGFPEIDEKKCRGCGKCVAACPRGVLSLMSLTEKLIHLNRTDECLAPCRQKCPAQVDMPRAIRYIREKDYAKALLKIKERNPLVLCTGRVCAHPCENICRRNISDQGVAICQLQRFVGEWEINSGHRIPILCAPQTDHRIAVIGGGPSGLSCAYFLRRMGHQPTVFEKNPRLGGMLRYGITEYRLPKRVVDWDINGILELGVKTRKNMTLGKDFSFDDLKSEGFQAVSLGMGAWVIPPLRVDGEYSKGVVSSLDFLSRVGTGMADITNAFVVVIGESNTAMDCARSAVRLGADTVTVICPVRQKDMSARKNDVTRAIEEGVVIHFLTVPTRIDSDENGNASHIEYAYVEPVTEAEGEIGKKISGFEEKIAATLIISAHERKPDLKYLLNGQKNGYGFTPSPKRTLDADKNTLMASPPNIFATGDMHTGRASVIAAVAEGRRAARSIHYLLTQGTIPYSDKIQKRINPKSILRKVPISEHISKVMVPELPVSLRKSSFIEEVQGTITEAQALKEASRCLRCGTLCNDR